MKKNKSKEHNNKKKIQLKNPIFRKYFSSVVLLMLSVVFVLLCLDYKHIQDDAFITFRYVKNFTGGNGLVFNAGEHVEGYTSILWIMILSVIHLLGFDIISFSQNFGVLLGVCSIWMTYFIAKNNFTFFLEHKNNNQKRSEFNYSTLAQLLPSIMLTFTGAFQYWSVSGMEVTLFVFLSLLSIYLYLDAIIKQKSLILFSTIATLNSLVRPEGIMLFAIIVLYHLFYLHKNFSTNDIRKLTKEIFSPEYRIPFLIFIVPNFLLLIFRLSYYGYPLPNTFYAKTGFTLPYLISGLEYIWDFLKTYLLYGTVLLFPLIIFKKIKSHNSFGLFPIIIILFFIYTISVGGDVLPLFRFLLPILPLIYISFVISVFVFASNLFEQKNNLNIKSLYPATIIIILAITSFNYFVPNEKIKKLAFYETQLVEKMSATGRWLQEKQFQYNRKLTVACTTIGAVSYYSDAVIIDMLGLTDAAIAHHPKPLQIISGTNTGWKERNYNVDYILSRQPDYIYFSTGIKPSAYAERALFLSENFINNYYPYFFNNIADFVETIFVRKPDVVNKDNFIKFNSNPDFDSNYVNLYNEALNLKAKPQNNDRVITLCEKIDKIRPLNFYWAQYQLALIYERLNDSKKVFSIMEEIAGKDDYLSLAHFYLGKKFARAQNFEKYKHHIDLVEKYNPEYLEYQRNHR
ncbi:MAG: hypothetical protein FIA82_10070 [Melioribacter sp.]|nr:hypothetical protein [Melioribacter sp.]